MAQKTSARVSHLETLEKPTERMVRHHERLTVHSEEMDVESAPVPGELAQQDSEKSLLLFCRESEISTVFVTDSVFVAGFKSNDLGDFKDLFDEDP